MEDKVFIEDSVVIKINKNAEGILRKLITNENYDNDTTALLGYYSENDGFISATKKYLSKLDKIKSTEIDEQLLENYENTNIDICFVERNGGAFYERYEGIKNIIPIKKRICDDLYLGEYKFGEYTYVFAVSTNTKSNNSVIDKTEVIELTEANSIEEALKKCILIKDNTIFITTSYIDSDGWIPAGESNDLYIIDKRNGKFEYFKGSSNKETLRLKNEYGGIYEYSSLLHPYYYDVKGNSKDIRKDNEIDDGIIDVCGRVFDTEKCDFINDYGDFLQCYGIYYVEDYEDDEEYYDEDK